jgi:uncharacterized protein YndB with AHSA1/START domain
MEALRYNLRVACDLAEAFHIWTAGVGLWWPMATHSVSGQQDAALVLEPWVGGRVFERVRDGCEFEWGRVLAYEPPHRLVCEWLVADVTTEVEARFTEHDDGGTAVVLEHRGWERFGDEARERRDANAAGWERVLPRYTAACPRGV